MYDVYDDNYAGSAFGINTIVNFPNGFTMIHIPTGKWLNFEYGSYIHKRFYHGFDKINFHIEPRLTLSSDIFSQFEIYHKQHKKYYSIEEFYTKCTYD